LLSSQAKFIKPGLHSLTGPIGAGGLGVSETQAKEDNGTGFFGDLAVLMSNRPYTIITFFGEIIKGLDEVLNDSDDIGEKARATIKYFLGKLVRSFSVFVNTYDKPALKNIMLDPKNLLSVADALGEALRAYHLLVTEDPDDDSPVVEDIAHALDDASGLIEGAVLSAISELSEKLASSNCLEQILSS
jgi:hypothetical protein